MTGAAQQPFVPAGVGSRFSMLGLICLRDFCAGLVGLEAAQSILNHQPQETSSSAASQLQIGSRRAVMKRRPSSCFPISSSTAAIIVLVGRSSAEIFPSWTPATAIALRAPAEPASNALQIAPLANTCRDQSARSDRYRAIKTKSLGPLSHAAAKYPIIPFTLEFRLREAGGAGAAQARHQDRPRDLKGAAARKLPQELPGDVCSFRASDICQPAWMSFARRQREVA